MKKTSAKKIAVIYHDSCPDGFGAAWAAWKKFGVKAEYYPTKHSDKPLSLVGKEVYFLDLVYKLDVMRKIKKSAAKVVVVDHHTTAKEAAGIADEALYDIKHSGAFLAWKYFHPGKVVPKLLLHIEDEDIWKFKLPGTAAVNARLELVGFDMKTFDRVVSSFEKPVHRRKFIDEGNILASYRTGMVRRLIEENAVPVKFLGYRTLAVNGASPFTSEIGNALCKIKPPIAIVWQEKKKFISISLRSDGSVDVSKIAARFGGGGHKAAAAFSIPLNSKKPWTYE